MEKSDGAVLSSQWATMTTDQKHELIQSIINFERSLVAHSFDRIGSIYYEKDLVDSGDSYSPTAFPKFVIGPTTDRRFLEDGRSAIKSDKGPCAFFYLDINPSSIWILMQSFSREHND
jgi:hypothetical protein